MDLKFGEDLDTNTMKNTFFLFPHSHSNIRIPGYPNTYSHVNVECPTKTFSVPSAMACGHVFPPSQMADSDKDVGGDSDSTGSKRGARKSSECL